MRFFLKVDEEGAEAAAATVMTFCRMSSASAPIEEDFESLVTS